MHDPTHVWDLDQLQMKDPMAIEVKPMRILKTCTKSLRNREVDECRVQCDLYYEHNSTWEDTNMMKK